MSCVIPEVVIQAALVAGMRYLREDPSRFGQLFRDFPKSKRDSIAQWFANNRVRLVMGFPEQTATFPLWSIRVMGDNESQSFIGDHLGNNILPRNAPVQYGQADEDSGESFFHDEPDLLGGGVTWQTGPTLQREEALGITDDPDDDRRELGDGGDPRWPRDTLVERHGAYYAADVQVQTLAEGGELVPIISHVARAIIHNARMFLDRNGLKNLVMGRRDLAPIAGYFPIVAFGQATTLRFDYLFEEQETGPSIESLSVVLHSLNFPGDTPHAL